MSAPRPPCPPPGPGDAAGERKRPRSPSTSPSATADGRRPGSAFPGPASFPPTPDDAPRMSAEGTDRLSAVVRQSPADLDALRGAVSDGADVTVEIRVDLKEKWDKNFVGYICAPALSLLIRRGELEAVLACLESPAAIDFTRTSEEETTPIHEIALANTAGWPEYNRRVLSAVVDRIARHPSDKVDWSTKVCGVNLLSLAAEHQLLSVFWPVLQSDVSYFADQTEPIRLTEDVWALDWAALGTREQRYFNKKKARFIDADEVTSRLWISCQRYPEPDYATIRKCVAAGADVMLKCGLSRMPLLSYYIRHGPVEVVECLLQTPNAIDFTVGDSVRLTPLHFVTMRCRVPFIRYKTEEEVRRLLHLLLDRIEQHPQQDVVDWGRKDNSGDEPISAAAFDGLLAPFVEVVFHERPVPYYTDHPGGIEITWRAKLSDMKRLPALDLMRFDFTGGINANF